MIARTRLLVRVEFSDALRLQLALKTAAACLAAYAAARGLGFSQAYWAVISAFIIVQLSLADTVRKGLLRTAGTAAGGLLGIGLVLLLPGRPYLAAVVVSLWALFLFSISGLRRYSYAVTISVITPFLVILSGAAGWREALAVAFDRSATIVLGVGISWLFLARIRPVDERRELLTACGKMIQGSLAYVRAVLGGATREEGRLEETRLRRLTRRIEYLRARVDFSSLPAGSPERIGALLTSLRSLLSYSFHLEENFPGRENPSAGPRFGRELFRFLSEVGKVPPRQVEAFIGGREGEIRRIRAVLEEERLASVHAGGKVDRSLTARRMFLFYLVETLGEIAEATNRGPEKEPGESPAAAPVPRGRVFDAATGRAALKKAAAIGVSALAWAVPLGNVQAVISAALITGQAQQTASYRKAFYRLLGTLLGGLAAIALLAASGGAEAVFAVLAALAVLLCSYVGLGDEDWNYIGLTAGICLILVLGAGPLEPGIPPPALRRLAGVGLGGLTAVIIVKFLFPLDLVRRLKELEDRLRGLYRVNLSALDRAVSGPGEDDDFARRRRELRAVTLDYRDVCRDIVWDRLGCLGRRGEFAARARRGLDIYRAFFPLFSIARSLARPGPGLPLGDKISLLLADLAGPAGGERGPAAWRKRVDGLLGELNGLETESGRTPELFFFARVFLHHLRLLIDLLPRGGRPGKITGRSAPDLLR
ncbi:MAG: FUSC family protein [Candidatus Erginobacter occultus]|nr:FUSC family protein [Candidatus Erginobacter occultus]